MALEGIVVMRSHAAGAGERNQRIKIQYVDPNATLDAYRRPVNPQTAWLTLATVWANVMEVTARDKFKSEQTMGVRMARMIILHRKPNDVNSSQTIVFDGWRWQIRGIAVKGNARREMELLVEAMEAIPGELAT